MSAAATVFCIVAMWSSGFLIGLAVGRTRSHSKPSEPLRTRPYNPVRFPYPTSHEQRRRMVMQDLTAGKLGIDEGKQFLHDHTLSVNDYKCAVVARNQLEDLDRFVKWIEDFKQSNEDHLRPHEAVQC